MAIVFDGTVKALLDRLTTVEGILGVGGPGSATSATVIAAGSTTARNLGDRAADVVNVKDHGAVGDGVTDDTAVINALSDLILSVVDGGGNPISPGTMYFPKGTYLVSTINLGSIVSMRGDGIGVTRIKMKDGVNASAVIQTKNFAALTGTNSTGGFQRNSITDLTVDGNKANNTAGRGLQLYGKGFHLRNLSVESAFAEGIYTEYGGPDNFATPNGTLEATLYNISTQQNGGDGLKTIGPHDMMLQSVVSFENGGWGWSCATAANATIVNTFNNTSGGIRVYAMPGYPSGQVGSIQGSMVVGSTGTGWGALIETGQGALLSASSFGGPTALELRGGNNIIQATLANSTVAALKLGGPNDAGEHGSGHLDLMIPSITSGYLFDVAGASGTYPSVVKATITGATGTLFNGTPFGDWHINGNGFRDNRLMYLAMSGPLHLATEGGAAQTGTICQGSGVPNNASGNNGDIYFRTDTPGTVNQRIYQKSAGAWVALAV